MRKYVVISTNENDNYLFFLPIIVWAWKQFGWNTIVMHSRLHNLKSRLATETVYSITDRIGCIMHELDPISTIREETVVQCSRLYAAHLFNDNSYLMTGDVDMLPLSNYWDIKKKEDIISVWGHDLTGYKHYPMCYIGMRVNKWKEVMKLDGIDIYSDMNKDITCYPQSRSNQWNEWWQVDQDIAMDKINSVTSDQEIYKHDRGIASNSHYPLGRIDRGCWDISLQQKERIDAHLLRPGFDRDNFDKIYSLIQSIFPTSNIHWIKEYRDKYITLN